MFVADAFTNKPFAGNPAGVCFLEADSNFSDMQLMRIAAEMKHSETAFVSPIDPSKGKYGLRWFTPTTEVKLCGHATLATAHVLYEVKGFPADTALAFSTLSGDLFVTRDKVSGRLQMNFPTADSAPQVLDSHVLDGCGKALGFVLADFVRCFYEPKSGKLFLEVTTLEIVKLLKPNAEALLGMKFGFNVRGISVFSTNVKGSDIDGKGFDVASRYFAPWVGIHEDPVNGSSHTILGPLMAKRLGKNSLMAYMASERTGVLGLKLLDGGRILLEGDARTTLVGSIGIPDSK